MVDVATLDRRQLLLIQAAIDVQTEETTFSGHNTKWAEVVDLVVVGRAGLKDWTDDELRHSIGELVDSVSKDDPDDEAIQSMEGLIHWARRSSRIDSVELDGTWKAVPIEMQAAWDREE